MSRLFFPDLVVPVGASPAKRPPAGKKQRAYKSKSEPQLSKPVEAAFSARA